MTYGLTALLIVLFGFQVAWGGSTWDPALWRMGVASGQAIFGGDWWRVVTAGYLHFGAVHLTSNLYGLLILGLVLEPILGSARYLLVFAFSSCAGQLFTAWMHPEQFGAGASAGIFGMMGALAGLAWIRTEVMPKVSRSGTGAVVAYFLFMNLLGSLQPGVSFYGHMGGLLTGFTLVATRLATWGAENRPHRGFRKTFLLWLYRSGALVVLAGVVLSFVMAFDAGRPWELWTPETVRIPLAGTQVSIEVPAVSSAHKRSKADEPWKELQFGRSVDPIIVQVWFRRLDEPLDAAGARELLEERRQHYEKTPCDQCRYAQQPQIREINGRLWLELEQVREGIELPRRMGIVADAEVDLEVSIAPGSPERWVALGRSLLDRVRASDGGP